MSLRRRVLLSAVLASAVLALAALTSGCAGKPAPDMALKVGPGVTKDTIALGVLTDMTGPFKSSALARIKGYELYLNMLNERGGVCGRKIELRQKDHGFDIQRALDGYFELEPQVLGLIELAGAPMTAAIEPDLMQTRVLTAPASWSASLLGNPHMMIVGTTYDLDVINGIDHFKRKGVLAPGNVLGHIYVEGTYGGNALEGSTFAADRWSMKVAKQPISETTADLTSQLAALRAAGAKAVMLSTVPAQTTLAVAAAVKMGWDVPFMVNAVGFDPAILETPTARTVQERLLVVSPISPFFSDAPGAREAAESFTAKYPGDQPSNWVDHGYVVAMTFTAVLEKACAEGDLSRDGVLRAFHDTNALDTRGLTGPLHFSLVGRPSSTQSYIMRPDRNAPGGLVVAESLFESELVKAKGTRAK